jgi:hypothetical protein
VHDFRRTFSTIAGGLGFDDFKIGVCLNHKTARGKVTGIYNRFEYLELVAAVEARLLAILGAG